MKTMNKHYQQHGNITLIQMETLEKEGFGFLNAEPAIEKGDLVIKELREEGVVNTLLVHNSTGNYYLLTDMDLLKGARQNRVVNTSVLIAPHSKQEINVSCVERSRWSYDSPSFRMGPQILDQKMRAEKAESLRMDIRERKSSTQSKIWGMIDKKLEAAHIYSETADYNSLLESDDSKKKTSYAFQLQPDCNGLAVFEDKQLVSFDIFGNREAYRYYFEKLSKSAIQRIRETRTENTSWEAEAFYRLEEFLDHYEAQLELPGEEGNHGAGEFRWSGDKAYPGFELDHEGMLVHLAGFARNQE